jgi:hypothetical protein
MRDFPSARLTAHPKPAASTHPAIIFHPPEKGVLQGAFRREWHDRAGQRQVRGSYQLFVPGGIRGDEVTKVNLDVGRLK